MDQKGNLETLDDLVHLVYKVLEDLQEDEDQEAPPDQWGNLEIMDKMERLESLDFKVFLVGLALWVLLVTRDLLVIKVQKVLLVCQGHLELEVMPAKMGVQEEVDHQDNLGQQEKEVYLEALDQEVSKVCLGLLERMVWLAKMEKLACKDHQE